METELPYYIAFSHCLGIGPQRFKALKSHFISVTKAYYAPEKDIAYIIGENFAKKFEQFRRYFNPKQKLIELHRKNIRVITQDNSHFPSNFKVLEDTPICLYVKGRVEDYDFENDNYFGIVGTRRPTNYGSQIAGKFSFDLATAGFVIVSGLALGIDAVAHKACLNAGQKTIAFLGCGVDIVYPPSNRGLYNEILKNGGLIVSEFPPMHTVLKGLFIARNRLISGLSRGVMVVEGTKDSGSLVTARYAAAQGKEVFAPPVPLTSELSEAPNILLKQGAKLVTDVNDVLEEFGMKIDPKEKKKIEGTLTADEKKLYNLLLSEPQNSDNLVNSLELSISDILSILSSLEIKGVIELNGEGKYQIKV